MNYLKQLYRFFNPKFQNVFLDYRVHNNPRYGHGKPNHPALNDLISKGNTHYTSILEDIIHFRERLWSLEDRIDPSHYFSWRNDFFPGLDTAVLYTMMATLKPKVYLEVGSGISTIIAAQAIKDEGLVTKIFSIDPHPRKEIKHIVDKQFRTALEDMDLQIINNLNEGDILLLDNSHRLLPNSDCTVFFLEILPTLKKGVIVHIHDIYLPADYPQFMCDRFYSEQYALAIALLLNPDRFTILAPNYYISQSPLLAQKLSSFWTDDRIKNSERHGGSFWMRIN